ncbi:MAG: UGSC family (seleno)protein [Hyphomicrobiaceae bacterium]|nr:UGSC family (seleno)protein [Hyphomicrobiaceae bacterium]
MLRVSAIAEAAGVPTSSLCCEGFLGQAKTTSVGLGYPNLALAVVPGHVDVKTADELRKNVLEVTVDHVIRNLTGEVAAVATTRDPDPQEIVLEGSFEDVNRLFLENGWSDGLPIVPPTKAKIAEFLAFTDRKPDEVIGTLLPDNRKATVWNVAVNGVMAGCRPEYMPILVAAVEAMADPAYGVEHSGNTPGADTLLILNGPLIKELSFNYEQGSLRDGFQPNTSIGRFWRLYQRNVAGFMLHQNDKGTFGNTWRVVLAENEDSLHKMGWPTIAADMGQAGANDGAVTISRFTGSNAVVSVFGDTAEKLVPYLATAIVTHTTWELIFTVGLATGTYRPLLVLSPLIAETIARSGWTKADLQKALFEQARMPAQQFEKYLWGWTNLVPGKRTLNDWVRLGKAPKVFAGNDPARLVPVVTKPEHIMVAVAGDPMRSNCHLLVHNGMLGFPTSKPVRLPMGWREKLRRAQG